MSDLHPFLSVIIPTYNGSNKIENCLNALDSQTYKQFEIIVIVDGSTDDTVSLLDRYKNRFADFKFVVQENQGRSVARNVGADIALGEILFFLDDDMRLDKHSVQKHVDFHLNSKYKNSILVGNQLLDYAVLTTDFQRYLAFLSRKWSDSISTTFSKMTNPFITAAHFSVSKKLFLEIGGFDRMFSGPEDYDLAVRFFEKNISLYFDPTVMGWHDEFSTMAAYIKRNLNYRKSRINLQASYPDRFQNLKVLDNARLVNKFKFYPFKFLCWVHMIDNGKLVKILPKVLRYRVYDYVLTAQASIFVNR